MANFKEQIAATTLLRNNIFKAMSKPTTAKEVSKMVGISCYLSQYHIYKLIEEGYVKKVGIIKLKHAHSHLYKKVANMGNYVMQPRAQVKTLEEKLLVHKPIKHENQRTFKHSNDKEHYANMNASKTQSKTTYYVNGSILSGVF